ncbi:MAG TPA: hypothetical protein VGL80_22240 [Pseudonocardiaceae bacterium]|jgi:hypothetical protein
MPHYPGQQPRRWPYAVVAVVVAVGAGLLVGRLTADGSTAGAKPASNGQAACPGGRDDAGRNAAAVCLVQAYFALGQDTDRDARLSDLVMSSQLDSTRKAYKALDAKVAHEYAAVAATNLSGSGNDITGQAWVAFVDSYKDNSAPAAQWWITSFGLHWQGGRWWLNGVVQTQLNATPATDGQAPAADSGFGPGWVAAGAS